MIQEGAIYEGQLEMAGIERSSLRPIRARSSIASAGNDPGQSERQSGNGTTYIRRLGSPEAPWGSQKGTLTITQQMTNPMLTGRSASSGRQARRREVYNLLLSWSPSIRGADAGAARFDRRAASDIASMR